MVELNMALRGGEMTATLSAADLRAERARLQIPIFILASRVGMHPFRLWQILNERRALTPAMARQIAKALYDKGFEIQEGVRGTGTHKAGDRQ